MIKTKSILLPLEDSDGLRISVMSRHTLNDGKTPDLRITQSSYTLWLPFLSSPKLVGDYYKRNLSWEQFEQKYLEYLQKPEIKKTIQEILDMNRNSIVTLLCIEESPKYCHRRLLAEECKRIQPSLELEIR